MNSTIELRVRPAVPMQMFTCVPYVLAMGVVSSLREKNVDAWIGWPASVVVDGQPVARVCAHAGYEDGMFADVTLCLDEPAAFARAKEAGLDEGALRDALVATCDSWEAALRRAQVVAGPLAPVMGEYFDLLELAQKDIEVVYPNGNLAARGVLAGLDAWGRITLRAYSGREVDFAPEQVSIRAAAE